jgi:hypothetical protein
MSQRASGTDDEQPIAPRLMKLGIAIGAAFILYNVFGDMILNLFTGARRAKLDGDFVEISKAIQHWEVEQKKRFEEWDLDKLQGSALSGTVRDPDGQPYIYDWFFRRLVYVGPDGKLQTVVAGKTIEPGDSDDEVKPFTAWDRLVYARADGGKTAIEMCNADGSEPKPLVTVDDGVIGVKGIASKDSNLVALTLKTATGSKLGLLDVGGEGAAKTAVQPLSAGDKHDEWPALYGATTEWMFYQSDRDSGSPEKMNIYKMSYKDKSPAKLTGASGGFEPAVELKSHWIWFAVRGAAGGSLWRFQLSNYADPEKKLEIKGKDLRCPSPSASGDYIAYLVNDGGKSTLEVADTHNGQVLFTTTDVLPDSAISWSPDDTKIGYLSRQDDGVKIKLTHVAKKVSLVLPRPVVGRSFAWLHD